MLSLLAIAVVVRPQAAFAGNGWWGGPGESGDCSTDMSPGPDGADVEITIGNLPPSTFDEPVYVIWNAAKKSKVAYSPLRDPAGAEIVDCFRRAYAKAGKTGFNGGKVLVSATGEATMRVHAPATYKGHRHEHGRRDPHVHFSICGQRGKPKKVDFTSAGLRIRGGCQRSRSAPSAVSYKVISAREISSNTTMIVASDTDKPESATMTVSADTDKPDSAIEKNNQEESADLDALEFSSVYGCLDQTQLFDQFSSSCASQCPVFADVANGQCVRKTDDAQNEAVIEATWRLGLDCNDKCWNDAAPVARHSVRLALADHMDITFQEAGVVRLRRDSSSPATLAHLTVVVKTRRLDVGSRFACCSARRRFGSIC